MHKVDLSDNTPTESHSFKTLLEEYRVPIQRWMLRILVDLRGYHAFGTLCGLGIDSDIIFHTLELDHLNDRDVKQPQIREAFTERQRQINTLSPEVEGTLDRNIHWLAQRLKLTDTEQKILGFLVLTRNVRALSETLDSLGDLDQSRAERALATILELPLKAITDSLRPDATLIAAGLMRVPSGEQRPLYRKLQLLGRLSEALLHEHSSPALLFRHFFQESTPPTLTREDYPHVSQDITLIHGFLTRALAQGLTGVNVLIHGPPGTGKTQLARVMAESLGARLYEVAIADRGGKSLPGIARFSAYQLTQNLLANQDTGLVLFDEIEDVFPPQGFNLLNLMGEETPGKAWVNDLLESNPVPTFWLSNHIDQIDPAYLRRFDYVLELGEPPQSVRAQALKQYLAPYPVRGHWLDRAAATEALTPAHVERAARVIDHLTGEPSEVVEQALDRIFGNTLEAMGSRYSSPASQPAGPMTYSLDYLNPDEDLESLAQGMRQAGQGRLCLYGPPGTGKTAFGDYLAEVVDRPCIHKRLSDLLGPYVGQTEKAIASAFTEARRQSAVLMIDEIDSLLHQRQLDGKSWEINQVNEFLTQMEAFEGILIATTNMMEGLDTAALRRFDLKIRFDYLVPDQVRRLLEHLAEEIAEAAPDDDVLQRRIARLSAVTPGDFMTVVRQLRLRGKATTRQALVDGLEKEMAAKRPRSNRPIGFVRN
ncbi:AAA ATPase central domain protein [Thiohalobacter thiocyanaticus]|uniref:AAA ATPase central domain protein n=1 Tax=Thiohalobacter thiocyanaticus TaxID=585455 RepID=A0A1Z4VQ22_9GAMM|nr:ATP-binding protein [Thiohalobacter thiocyanaticus]BAZ93736.1 AAA ATPase central domain protein [Thiohalobacter thiocyanaticus]